MAAVKWMARETVVMAVTVSVQRVGYSLLDETMLSPISTRRMWESWTGITWPL